VAEAEAIVGVGEFFVIEAKLVEDVVDVGLLDSGGVAHEKCQAYDKTS